MRLRFTEPASFELEESISYFIDQAPASAADFADSIDAAVARLLDFPYSAQEAGMPGIRRAYIRRFRYNISTLLRGTRLSFSTFAMPGAVGHGNRGARLGTFSVEG